MPKYEMKWALWRKAFITGLFLLLPLGVTLIVFQFLVSTIGEPFRQLLFSSALNRLGVEHNWVGMFFNLIAIAIVMVFVTVFGYFSNYFFGKLFFNSMEKIIASLPFVDTVYKTSKQIINTLMESQKSAFQKAVLIEYPRAGCYSIGFLTSEQHAEQHERTGKNLVSVFIPTTPNPTSGFLLMIPKEEVIVLNMSIGDAMKLIISGGALVPPQKSPVTDGTTPSSAKDHPENRLS